MAGVRPLTTLRVSGPVLLSMSFAAMCTAVPAGADPSMMVKHVSDAQYEGPPGDALESACRQWRLSPQQVESFFRHSDEYADLPYAGFYQIPCSISGVLVSGGVEWDFTIGGGATAAWRHGEDVRHWGCSATACAALVLMPTDSMNPEE